MTTKVPVPPFFRVDKGDALCSIGQVGDREWWCSTHKRNAEDCEQPTENRDRLPRHSPAPFPGAHTTRVWRSPNGGKPL